MSHMVTGRCIGRIDPRSEMLLSVVVKETLRIVADHLEPDPDPEPLLEDRDLTRTMGEGGPELVARVPDLIPIKAAPDLVVLATARVSPARTESEVTLEVGDLAHRRLRLIGPRRVELGGGRLVFSAPEPFEQMPLSWDRAYGGIDDGVPLPQEVPDPTTLLRLLSWHPGSYARNPIGRGFALAGSERALVDLPLPCVEHPDDLLTPRRLVCPDMARWHRQPRPAGFGWVPGDWYPRCVYLGGMLSAWPDLHGPIPEEELGLMPQGLTARMAQVDALSDDAIHPGYFQEAAPGLSLPGLERVGVITVHGVDNNRPVVVRLPHKRPVVTLDRRSSELQPPSRLLTLLLDLDEQKVIRLWAAPIPLRHPSLASLKPENLMELAVRVDYRG